MQAPVILVAPEVAKKMILIVKLSGKVEFIFLISFKVLLLFNITSADIKTKSADVILKSTTIRGVIRISTQPRQKYKRGNA